MDYKLIISDEKVFEALGLDIKCLEAFDLLPEQDREPMKAHYIMVKAIEAINEGYKADLFDFSQRKYALWPDIDISGSVGGFSYCGYGYVRDDSFVGARRIFKDRERAKHFWEYFKHHFVTYSVFKKLD